MNTENSSDLPPSQQTPPTNQKTTENNSQNHSINESNSVESDPSSFKKIEDKQVSDSINSEETYLSEESHTNHASPKGSLIDQPQTETTQAHPRNTTTRNTTNSRTLSKTGLRIIIIATILVAISLGIIYQTLFGRISQSGQMVEIKQGQSYYGIISQWKDDIPLFSESIAKLYIKLQGNTPLHTGSYEIPKNPNFVEIMRVLRAGADSAVVKIQIIEGRTAKDLYQKIRESKGIELTILGNSSAEQADHLKSALGIKATTPKGEFSDNLEGWFAPDTYIYAEGVTDKKILKDLYQRQRRFLSMAWQNRAAGLPYKSPYEALIMASIIEKETGLAEERAKVAGVFVNRLNQGMRLQTDPTIIYGMGDRYDGDIRKKDIQEKTPYNTYQIDGLPPTPISLPSAASIDAALHPADTDALYFVATGKGGHTFSRTYAEHQKAVASYLNVIYEQKNNAKPKN